MSMGVFARGFKACWLGEVVKSTENRGALAKIVGASPRVDVDGEPRKRKAPSAWLGSPCQAAVEGAEYNTLTLS